ncbi:helix-hairpin-helix domain-containing protein [Paenibacillus solani]|uniref:helix-hairpin-helix domain-containing protein n=1 Tax=Paenibacillus solani TaxID=1705565 RepID=UPI003D29EADA
MKRIPLGWSLAATIAGCGFILFAGGSDKGLEGWQALNDQLAEVLVIEEKVNAKVSGPDPKEKDSGQTAAVVNTNVVKDSEVLVNGPASSQDPGTAGLGSSDPAPPVTSIDPPASSTTFSDAVDGSMQSQQPLPANESSVQTTPPADQNGLINVNTADVAALMELPGIGEAKAKAIINYRNQFGPFRSKADLMNVKGIGPKILEKMKPYVGL